MATLKDGVSAASCWPLPDFFLVLFVTGVGGSCTGSDGKVGDSNSGNAGMTTTGATSAGETVVPEFELLSSSSSSDSALDELEVPGEVALGNVGVVRVGRAGNVGTVSAAGAGKVGTVSAVVAGKVGTAIDEVAEVEPCVFVEGSVGVVSAGNVGVVSAGRAGNVGVGNVGVGNVGDVICT